MDLGLQGNVAVVTGAAGGLGGAICRRFLEEGARVVAVDRDAPKNAMSGEWEVVP